MELQYKQQPLHNNFMGASYASGGLQGHTWEFQWGPQGLELAIKRIGMSPVITQNFSTDPMGRILSMTYQGPTYGGELYFHYDVQGNTSLLTDSNGQAVASFRYDLHNGRIAASWNPANLEIVNLKGGRQGSIRITTAVTGFDRDIYIPSWPPIEINPHPVNGNGNGNDWGGIGVSIDTGVYIDNRAPDADKDCGDDYSHHHCSWLYHTMKTQVGFIDEWEAQRERYDKIGMIYLIIKRNKNDGSFYGVYLVGPEDSWIMKRWDWIEMYSNCTLLSFLGLVNYKDCIKGFKKAFVNRYIDEQKAHHEANLLNKCNQWEDMDCDEWARKNMNYYDLVIDEVEKMCARVR